MKRLKKECNLEVSKHISLKYGSIDRNNPQVVYVSGKCWISPSYGVDYTEAMEYAEKGLRKDIRELLANGTDFDSRFILDFDINTEGLSVGRKTFLSFDFFLRQKNRPSKDLKDLEPIMKARTGLLSGYLVSSLAEYGFSAEAEKKSR